MGGWGGDRQRNRQVNAQALPKLPFSDLQSARIGCARRGARNNTLLRRVLRIGILPGWHGMENGQKPEIEKKKKEIEMENGPKLDRGKNGQKWKNNGKLPQIYPFVGPSCAMFAPVQLGAVFHFDFLFFSRH